MKHKILIIDDEKGFTSMLRINLESTKMYEVWVENNPEMAVSTAIRFQPDLILLDVIMPRMEGPDVAFEMRQRQDLCSTPVIFLTATITQQEAEVHSGMVGGNQFIAKPSNLGVLLESIERNLEKSCA